MSNQIEIQENVALAALTTLKVGGAAKFFARAESETQIIAAIKFARAENLPLFILGGGSNLLVGDNGFKGLVIHIVSRGIEFENDFVTAQAGENWDEFVKICVTKNLAGVECLSGIPGSVGATPVQNVGAYGQEVAETIESVRVLDLADLQIKNFSNAECGFAYRTSIFNTTRKNCFVVLAVTFRLTPNGAPNLKYADLQKHFGGETATLTATREAVLTIRAAKSMVISESDENRRSAGSFFKNPIVSLEEFNQIQATARSLNLIAAAEQIPHYPADDKIKIPAAWLIEKSGFHKGFTRGNVGISTKHTLAIVNRGNATAREIVQFVREIQSKVIETFGVELHPEPIWIGFEK